MESDTNPFQKSVYLFPAVDVSEDVNFLKQLFLTVNLGMEPSVSFNQNTIIDIKTKSKKYTTDYYGDCIEFKDSITGEFLFFGFINNIFLGYGTIPFKLNKSGIKKSNIKYKMISTDLDINSTAEIDQEFVSDFISKSFAASERFNNGNGIVGFTFLIPYKNYKNQSNMLMHFKDITIDASFEWDSIKNLFTPSFNWKINAPKLYFNGIQRLWDETWVLHRLNTYYPEKNFQYKWVTPCRFSNYQFDKMTMWDTIHIIEDLKWYDIEAAVEILEMQFGFFRKSDGMVAQDRSCGDTFDEDTPENRIQGKNFTISQPPLWSYSFIELSKMLGDYGILGNAYEKMVKNIQWWEKDRYFPEYKLFGYDLIPQEMGGESGLDNSPRFFYQYNGTSWNKVSETKKRKLIPVDLNAQMADYYQNLGIFAMIRGDEKSNEYFTKAEQIIDNMNLYLWDDDKKFFFDYDLDVKQKQSLFTASSFWALFGGCVLKRNLHDFVKHLTDPKKFWTELPIPSVSLNSEFFSKDMWSGPVWLSQNYWIILGLKRYSLGPLAAEVALKCFQYLEKSYFQYNKIFEFYNPTGISQKKLLRKGSCGGPYPNYLGHFPIHSMFYYGIMGAEILDNNINFIPDLSQLKNKLGFEFYYNNKKLSYKSENIKKLIEIYRE